MSPMMIILTYKNIQVEQTPEETEGEINFNLYEKITKIKLAQINSKISMINREHGYKTTINQTILNLKKISKITKEEAEVEIAINTKNNQKKHHKNKILMEAIGMMKLTNLNKRPTREKEDKKK